VLWWKEADAASIGPKEVARMLYLLAIVLPPLAVLICGKPGQAALNLVLTCLLWIPGVIHAFMVVNNHYADQRTSRVIKAMGHK
jgi:uncharacterized membrane protein YqaE (UPF0057 family)